MTKKRFCKWEGCKVDITGSAPNQKYCSKHSKTAERKRKRTYAKKRYGGHTSLNGRILLDKYGMLRESKIARAKKKI